MFGPSRSHSADVRFRPQPARLLCRARALALGLALASSGPGAAPANPPPAPLPENQSPVSPAQLDRLTYRILGGKDHAAGKKAIKDPTLNQQFDLLNLEHSKVDHQKNVKPDPPPPLDKRNWVPNWLGTTGGLDMPWAYSLPQGQFAVSLIAKNRSADSRFWPQVYNRIDGSDRGLTLTYGVMEGVEVTADVDRWDRNFAYAPQPDLNNPAAPATSATFHSNRTIFGGGLKGTAATEDLQFAFGFHTAAYRNVDRSIIEFHDYDRLNNFYAVASTAKGSKLAVHLSARYVTYDWSGSVFPSGATLAADPTGAGRASVNGIFVDPSGIARRGFAPGLSGLPVFRRRDGTLTQDPTDPTIAAQVGVGTNNWYNVGIGVDFEPSKHLRLIGELNSETAINFAGAENWFANVGARYTRQSWATTFGLRHVNSRGYREPVLSVAYRF